jgi:hypothetical protein
MTSRSDTDKKVGLYLAAKGGHNGENHNHNDVGNFIIYKHGQPFIIDVGVETYTRKTFSRERYEIWTMNSDFHNLPTINGIKQKNGLQYKSSNVLYRRASDGVVFSLDISGAYPQEAEVASWQRKLVFRRNKSVELNDTYQLLRHRQPVEYNFITPYKPLTTNNGILKLMKRRGLSLTMQYPDQAFKIETEEIKIEDNKLKNVWGNQIYRIKLIAKLSQLSASHTITFK